MSARGALVFMVALLSFVLGASNKDLSEQAECRGVCSQAARNERSKTAVKVRYGLLLQLPVMV